jgi:hypothetical protein
VPEGHMKGVLAVFTSFHKACRSIWNFFHGPFDETVVCPWCKRDVHVRFEPVRPYVVHTKPVCPHWARGGNG